MQTRSMDDIYGPFFDFSKKIAQKVCHDFCLIYFRSEILYYDVLQLLIECQHLCKPSSNLLMLKANENCWDVLVPVRDKRFPVIYTWQLGLTVVLSSTD